MPFGAKLLIGTAVIATCFWFAYRLYVSEPYRALYRLGRSFGIRGSVLLGEPLIPVRIDMVRSQVGANYSQLCWRIMKLHHEVTLPDDPLRALIDREMPYLAELGPTVARCLTLDQRLENLACYATGVGKATTYLELTNEAARICIALKVLERIESILRPAP